MSTRAAFTNILCDNQSDGWTWDSEHATSIRFNRDGTGTLRCCAADLKPLIASLFKWRFVDTGNGIDPKMESKETLKTLVGRFNVEITLTRQHSPVTRKPPHNTHAGLSDTLLTEDAYLPKTFNLAIQRGKFLAPDDRPATTPSPGPGSDPSPSPNPKGKKKKPKKFMYHLLFDKSPLPPQEEWTADAALAVDNLKLWERVEFVNRKPHSDRDSGDAICELFGCLVCLSCIGGN